MTEGSQADETHPDREKQGSGDQDQYRKRDFSAAAQGNGEEDESANIAVDLTEEFVNRF